MRPSVQKVVLVLVMVRPPRFPVDSPDVNTPDIRTVGVTEPFTGSKASTAIASCRSPTAIASAIIGSPSTTRTRKTSHLPASSRVRRHSAPGDVMPALAP
jgi:hypothetical protein